MKIVFKFKGLPNGEMFMPFPLKSKILGDYNHNDGKFVYNASCSGKEVDDLNLYLVLRATNEDKWIVRLVPPNDNDKDKNVWDADFDTDAFGEWKELPVYKTLDEMKAATKMTDDDFKVISVIEATVDEAIRLANGSARRYRS